MDFCIKCLLKNYKIVKNNQVLKFYENQKIYEFYVKNKSALLINLFPDEVQIAIALGDFVPDNTVGKRAAVKKEPANAGSLDLDLIFQERGLDLDYMQKVLQDYN